MKQNKRWRVDFHIHDFVGKSSLRSKQLVDDRDQDVKGRLKSGITEQSECEARTSETLEMMCWQAIIVLLLVIWSFLLFCLFALQFWSELKILLLNKPTPSPSSSSSQTTNTSLPQSSTASFIVKSTLFPYFVFQTRTFAC